MRIFSAVCLFLLVFSLAAPVSGESEETRLKRLQKQLMESKQKLQKTKAEEQAVWGKLVVINKQLKRTKNSLYAAQNRIQTNRTQIGELTSELNKVEAELREKEVQVSERITEVYKSSGVNYLEILIASRSMSDFFNRLYFFRKIIDFDAQLIQSVRADARRTKQKRALLMSRNSEIQSLAVVISRKKNEIASKANEKRKVYKTLKQRRLEHEARVAELEKSSKELEVLILKKMAARKGGKVLGSGKMAWPLKGRITSRFGYRRHPLWGGRHHHTGLDIAAKYGSPIRAGDSGEIIFAGWWDGYGKAIVIDHGRKTTTVYGHMSRIYKQVGTVVAKGQIIGLVGSTGYSTGPHLHFEVRKNGKPVNPIKFL